jgi:hypothetical protein
MPDTLIKVDLSQSAYDNDMIHNRWRPDIPMVATVKPDDEFIIECYDWTGGFIKNNDSAADVRDIDLSIVHFLSGPIGVAGDRVAQRRAATGRGHNAPNPVCYLSDTDIVRASKRQHPVQGSGSKANLGRLGSVGARSKGIADHTFVSPDRRLDLGPLIVAAGFLPDHLAAIGDGQHANPWGLFRLLTDRPGRVPLGRFWAHKMRVSWCRSWYGE